MELLALEERLGYSFVQHTLLEQALTHRSHGAIHNERLEFLGDAVLNCAIAQILFRKYVRLDEGDLSRLRANLVKQQSLDDIAEQLVLSDFLRVGEGEMKSGGFRRPSILAATMEAIFGAIFLDSGFDAARGVIARLFEPVLKTVDRSIVYAPFKAIIMCPVGALAAGVSYVAARGEGETPNYLLRLGCTGTYFISPGMVQGREAFRQYDDR